MSAPIDVGAVIRRVFKIYVDEASVLMPAAAVVFVITGIVTELLLAKGAEGLTLLAEIISLVANTLFTGMVVELVADVRDGRRDSSPGQLLRAVTPVLGQLIAVAIVTGICEFIGLLLIVVPCLIMLTVWAVVAPVVVIERPGGLRALGRSRELVRGNGWQVFGVVIMLVLGVEVLVGIVGTIGGNSSTALGIVVRVVIGVLAAPISSLAAAVLYFELRERQPGGFGLGEDAMTRS